MAYVAVISVMRRLQGLLNSLYFLSNNPTYETILSANDVVLSLKQALERFDNCRSRKRMKDLDEEIREAVFKLEDVIESNLSAHLFSQSEYSFRYSRYTDFSIDVKQINPLVKWMKNMKETYVRLLDHRMADEEEEDNYIVSSTSTDFKGKKKSSIVGLSDAKLTRLKQQLTKKESYEFRVVSVVGEGRTTRTILARLVFEQSSLLAFFQKRAVVTVGPKYELKDILIDILSQMDQKLLRWEDEKLLQERLYKCLKGTRYLIVLDDVYETEVWNLLSSSFPMEDNYGSRVFITTSVMEVARYAGSHNIHELNILNKDESWNLVLDLNSSKYSPNRAQKISQIQLFLSKTMQKAEENHLIKDEDLEWKTLKASKFRKLKALLSCYEGVKKTKKSRFKKGMHLPNSIDEGDASSRTNSAEIIAQMFQLFDYVDDIMFVDVHRHLSYEHLTILSLFGMVGIGKTTLARNIFEDPFIISCFDLRVWITLGPNYQSENILADILAQIDAGIDQLQIMKGYDQLLAEQFWTKTSCKRCLIVLDDVWSEDPLHYLHKLFKIFKFEVLLTTRLKQIADFAELSEHSRNSRMYKMQLLSKEESWCFLSECLFGEKILPFELKEAGKMIAENCDGLPLMIVTVASFLSEADKTPEYWTEVAKKKNSVFEEAYDEISKMLYPSYEYLSHPLKACLLYMAVFPQKYGIPTSKLFMLWRFDGIVDLKKWEFEDNVMKYATELVSRSLVLEEKTSSSFGVKTCRLHSVYWHFCIREARKNMFFHVLNRISDGLEEYMEGHRRLCIQNNILFGMKDIRESIASVSTALRSLLCTGPYHKYEVPVCLDLRFLRVLDALSIRFYEFPIGVVHLVLLHYLGLTYDGVLPPTIFKLINLECLIIHRHHHTKFYGAPLYLPKHIWLMKALKHLQVMGGHIRDPWGSSSLPNLVTLLDINSTSYTRDIIRGTKYLKKLGLRIEHTPDSPEPTFSFDHLNHLASLESLKCFVVNPELIRSETVAPQPPITSLPSKLRKLSLSGFGYPWEYLSTIAALPNLEVLKLRCYAFRGPEWVVHKNDFKRLEYLLLEDTDLEYLETHYDSFKSLRRLIIRHCYKLKKLAMNPSLSSSCIFELVDCGTSASAIIQGNPMSYDANVQSSWEK